MGGTVALIPARGGSKRVPGKNIRPIAGAPLIAYTISAAQRSNKFDHILVSSDDIQTLEIASEYGADAIKRPDTIAGATSPDIEWVHHALGGLSSKHRFTEFSILRPTAPFRTSDTIIRAFNKWNEFRNEGYTSLRAIEPVTQHPGKMWRLHSNGMMPLLPQPSAQPWHDSQYTVLPSIYVQNACLEISLVETVEKTGTISGERVLPFFTEGNEGLDINSELDWTVAELLVEQREAFLPDLSERIREVETR